MQPPSRGWVLKLLNDLNVEAAKKAAAFARLCVETLTYAKKAVNEIGSRLRAAVC